MRHLAGSGTDVAFLFIGGMHQAMHMAPVAVALARRPGVAVTAYVLPGDAPALTTMLDELDADAAAHVTVVSMQPRLLARLSRWLFGLRRGSTKALSLIDWRSRLLRHDVLVAAERTSTLLKRLPGRRPLMVHIPHGAGDRAKGFEPRIRHFDHVLVPGPGNLERMLAANVVTPRTCTVVGAIKLSALIAKPPLFRLFDDDRPVVLYNPHFDTNLSSWPLAWGLVDAIVADGRFNLIVAPHARLGAGVTADERKAWAAYGDTPGVLIDFASERLWDTTYTRAADIYLGDVSSQIYEFVHRPRAAVFVNAHGVDWTGDASYRMWTMGEVCSDVPGTVAALARAQERHVDFAELQAEHAANALGFVAPDVPDRAADAIISVAGRRVST